MNSTPIPESRDLPARLDTALTALTEPSGPTVTFTVLPDPESVTEARHFTISRLCEWGVGALVDDVGLVVSELVTNALRHSGGVARWRRPGSPVRQRSNGPAHQRPSGPAHQPNQPNRFADPTDPIGSAPSAIRLRLVHEAPWVLCGIIDASPAAPRRKEPDYIAETGRGLHLVESFSVRWGWRGLAHGKVVWALFRTP
ncbi:MULTISPECIES: ATP-binding protein [Thermomonosporaceae]|uniref:ATP-binding protein n=1 Tax=Thermomonosporaceae TaxID=2012 RepID=UPI00255AEABC|nr:MULTISPECIES: ATP-binding protein [Thermomonosporaceae]MDL4772619.1 ATP-binding protein [Actinomadura xylanilytica]